MAVGGCTVPGMGTARLFSAPDVPAVVVESVTPLSSRALFRIKNPRVPLH